MGRAPCCEKVGMKKGRWTAEEDDILTKYIQAHGEGSWRSLPKKAGLLRCGKSCRLRWINYLRTDLKRGNISAEEEEVIINLHSTLGNRWSLIAGHLPGRTDNEIKNYWNSHLSRKMYAFRRPVTNPDIPKPKSGKISRWAMKKNRINETPTKTSAPEKESLCLDKENELVSGPYPQEGIIPDRTSGNLLLCPTNINGYEEDNGPSCGRIDDFGTVLYCIDPKPKHTDTATMELETSVGDSNSINNQWFSSSPCLDWDLDDQLWRDIANDDNLMSYWLQQNHDHDDQVEVRQSDEKQNALVAWLFS